MRHVSREQRRDVQNLRDIFMMLCLTLEKRLVKKELFAKRISFFAKYEDGTYFEDKFHTNQPLQDGMEIFHVLEQRQNDFERKNKLQEKIINNNMLSIGIVVTDFVHDEAMQLNLFDNGHIKSNQLRKTVYGIKEKYGHKTIKRASELREEDAVDDVIGFGNIKDLNGNDFV